MNLKHLLIGAGAAAVITLQSCGGSAVAADPSTPDGAIMTNVQAAKANDCSALVDCILTAEQRSKAAAQWEKQRNDNPPTPNENEQFAQQMDSLVSGAMIDQVMPMVEAQLGQYTNEQIKSRNFPRNDVSN